jgi:hypothetical protein
MHSIHQPNDEHFLLHSIHILGLFKIVCWKLGRIEYVLVLAQRLFIAGIRAPQLWSRLKMRYKTIVNCLRGQNVDPVCPHFKLK